MRPTPLDTRRARAERALNAHRRARGVPAPETPHASETELCEALGDLLHLAAGSGAEPERVLARALQRYMIESGDARPEVDAASLHARRRLYAATLAPSAPVDQPSPSLATALAAAGL